MSTQAESIMPSSVDEDIPEAPAMQPELSPADPDDDEGDGDDDGEDDPLYDYVILYKNGHITNHQDSRPHAVMLLDLRFAHFFPITAKSMMTDEEHEYWEELAKADPKRFQKRDVKMYAFVIGEGTGEDGEPDELEFIDPREIQALVSADSFGPPPPRMDYGDDHGDDPDDPEPEPIPTPPLKKINGAGKGSARERLRQSLGRG